MDNQWYLLDITNNDNDEVENALFNLNDTQASGILVSDNSALLQPANYGAIDNSKEYYYVNDKSASDVKIAKDILVKQLNTSETAKVRLPLGVTEDQVNEIVNGVV